MHVIFVSRMSTNDIPSLPNDSLPLYLQLVEKPGTKTNALVDEIKKLAHALDVSAYVSFQGIFPRGDRSAIVFQVEVINKMRTSEQEAVVKFLGQVFQRFPNKFPAFEDAETVEQYWSDK